MSFLDWNRNLITLLVLNVSFLVYFCDGFVVEPMGLSGQFTPLKNYAKSGKLGQGVSWSKNLDAELDLRKKLCGHIPERSLYQFRYDNNTRQCYRIGGQGPCGENMVFFGWQTNAVYGQCDCDYNDNSRAMIHDAENDKCHFVYQRGYCKENQWLTFDENYVPKCEPNTCLAYYQNDNSIFPTKNYYNHKTTKSTFVEYVPYQGSCVLLGASCLEKDMQWASLSHLPHEIQFVKGKLNPRCAPNKFVAWRYPTPRLQCVPGSFLTTVLKKCQPIYEL